MRLVHVQLSDLHSIGGGNRYRESFLSSYPNINQIRVGAVSVRNSDLENDFVAFYRYDDCSSLWRFVKSLFIDVFFVIKLLKKLRSLKNVTTIMHGVHYIKSFTLIESVTGLPLNYFVYRMILNRVDVFILHNNHSDKNTITGRNYLRISAIHPKKISVDFNIYSAVNNFKTNGTNILIPNPIEFSERINPRNDLTFCFIGRVNKNTLNIEFLNEFIGLTADCKWILCVTDECALVKTFSHVERIDNASKEQVDLALDRSTVLINPVTHGGITRVTLEAIGRNVYPFMFAFSERHPDFKNYSFLNLDKSPSESLAIVKSSLKNKEQIEQNMQVLRKSLTKSFARAEVDCRLLNYIRN